MNPRITFIDSLMICQIGTSRMMWNKNRSQNVISSKFTYLIRKYLFLADDVGTLFVWYIYVVYKWKYGQINIMQHNLHRFQGEIGHSNHPVLFTFKSLFYTHSSECLHNYSMNVHSIEASTCTCVSLRFLLDWMENEINVIFEIYLLWFVETLRNNQMIFFHMEHLLRPDK